ncbi:glycine cleavage system regulatory protein [Desulfosarcina ovata subsp. sediminis]|uniref:Glycine cleavage system regulatory protein n=1 Tax=Desulfosarcina ovata subsp. sediminis TaxID=885957 RepID=A0A5K7ZWI3_9BACT|nr:ACT domain-containing protein [Desulfosarcina ovata]BBO84612.1 glycine cleavage system regulatory protein [Desulfosarcina ovata subsp. sediminis]
MTVRFIMTAFGEDRPGIAADVTEILYENDCNLEDASMTLLAGEFTLILLFSASTVDVADHLSRACRRLEMEKGISAFFRPVESPAMAPGNGFTPATLHVEGLDHGGIVYKVSRFLADHGVNIADLKSTVKASPESGTAIYHMDIAVQIPGSATMETLKTGLSTVADDLNVDVTLSTT